MCGIIGCTGELNALSVLRQGLRALEYRGYDSAGVSFFGDENAIITLKSSGKIVNLEEKIDCFSENNEKVAGAKCGIGHTRWATHGEPSERNSHPHGNDRVRIVHNGIIENYREITEKLCKEGYKFTSETDTEAAALLIDFFYKKLGEPLGAISEARKILDGSYAIGVIFYDRPGKIYALRKDNPLIVGISENESFIASDITAILPYTRDYIRLSEDEIACLDGKNVTFFGENGTKREKNTEKADWNVDSAKKGGYEHFMLKEIFEEPEVLEKTLAPRINSDDMPDFSKENIDIARLASSGRIIITACGTAMHAGYMAKYFIEKYAKIPVNVEIASEMRYSDMPLSKDDSLIVISQSGETADTLASLRLAKENGLFVTSMVNVVGSTIARESDSVLYTWAGPEIAVASTKAYVVQSALCGLLALSLAYEKKMLSENEVKELTSKLFYGLPSDITSVLEMKDEIYAAADTFKDAPHLFCVGRSADYYAALEASLKIKEVSYIHTEAYAAGEMKHGTISLIEKGTPIIALSTNAEVRQKMLGNIRELSARGAYVVSVTTDAREISPLSDKTLEISEKSGAFAPIALATLLQLMAYMAATARGCDVDCPRNLAKSVTVE